MATTLPKPLLVRSRSGWGSFAFAARTVCRLTGHRWAMSWYGDTQIEHYECKRCGHPGVVIHEGVTKPLGPD
jgi:Zn ribbon nucleic-acid-binding protein